MADEWFQPFVGEWELTVDLPGAENLVGQVTFALVGAILVQTSTVPDPDAPDSICVALADGGNLVQYYFDSRGVARRYAMTWDGSTWTLERTQPDLSPLAFGQRFVGHLDPAGGRIDGEWHRSDDGVTWQRDFRLTYRRRAG